MAIKLGRQMQKVLPKHYLKGFTKNTSYAGFEILKYQNKCKKTLVE